MRLWNRYWDLYDAQIRWIRRHPWKYVALNVALTAAWVGSTAIWERKQNRKLQAELEEIRRRSHNAKITPLYTPV